MSRIVRPSQTRTEMTWIVMPGQANALGTVFGGQIMAWVDVCAAVAAQRFCRLPVVTVAMDELHFRASIHQGDVAVLHAMVNWAGTSSMEVGVRVEGENPRSGERTHTSTAYLTFVALDDQGRPTTTPSLAPESSEELRRFADAERRRARRLRAREEDRRLRGDEP